MSNESYKLNDAQSDIRFYARQIINILTRMEKQLDESDIEAVKKFKKQSQKLLDGAGFHDFNSDILTEIKQ